MKIMVNGTEQEIEQSASISDVLAQRGTEKTLVSVELNFSIIPRDKWDSVLLEEGDIMEIIRFVGGG